MFNELMRKGLQWAKPFAEEFQASMREPSTAPRGSRVAMCQLREVTVQVMEFEAPIEWINVKTPIVSSSPASSPCVGTRLRRPSPLSTCSAHLLSTRHGGQTPWTGGGVLYPQRMYARMCPMLCSNLTKCSAHVSRETIY